MVGIEALLGQEGWVRRLAQALVRDDDEAEDVIQEARLASWRQPPADPTKARSWLGTVVRNVVRNRARAEQARQRLRAEVLEGEAPSAHQLVERLEVHRALAQAVSQMAEPFREVVLLRYYEGLSAAEIARRLDVPAGTIRWRLRAGLDRLRATLDGEHGRRDWVLALGPLMEKPARVLPASSRLLAWSGAAAVVLTVAGATVVRRDPEVAPILRPQRGPTPPALRAAVTPTFTDDVPAWAQLEGVPRQAVAGRVVSQGKPVAGARLRLSSGALHWARSLDRQATSRADGTFAFPPQAPADWYLTVSAPGLEPALFYLDLRVPSGRSVPGGRPADALVVELPTCRTFVRGTVRENGGPIAGARVRFAAPMNNGGVEATTDGGGRYELCIRGGSTAYALVAGASGYGTLETQAPAETRQVDFVLEPQGIVAGRAVREDDGEAVAGVQVRLLPMVADANHPPEGKKRAVRLGATTDAAGQFEIAGVAPGRYVLHVAGDEATGTAVDTVTLAAGQQVRDREMRLAAVAVVEGQVFRQGAPVPNADLMFNPAGRLEPVRNRANGEAKFRVRLPRGRDVRILALVGPGRWVPVTSPPSLRAGAGTSSVRVELPPGDTTDDVTPPGKPAPPPAHALEARFGEQVRFVGYDLSGDRVARGGQLEVTLHFQSLAPLPGWRLFVHAVGPRLLNLDHGPVRGTYPVEGWQAGETIRDRFPVRIAPNLPPGTYTLVTGFWKGATRLPVRPDTHNDGEDRLRVLTFTVD
jgi:RNA polymerase sigma factor (sigma-70 family)